MIRLAEIIREGLKTKRARKQALGRDEPAEEKPKSEAGVRVMPHVVQEALSSADHSGRQGKEA